MASASKKANANKLMVTILAITTVAGFGLAAYTYSEFMKIKQDPTAAVRDSRKQGEERILQKMGKLIELPKDDAPSFSKISDESLSGNVPFLKNGKKGDHLVIFPKAQKAFLYRESENRLINVGPVSLSKNTKPPAKAAEKKTEDAKKTDSQEEKKDN